MTNVFLKILLAFSIFFTIIGLEHFTEQKVFADTNIQTYNDNVKYQPFVPSSPPQKLFFLCVKGGFSQQPDKYYSKKVGSKLIIPTEVIRPPSLRNLVSKKKSIWWESTDLKKWTKVQNNDSADLTVNTSTAGIKYYQLHIQFSLPNIDHFYSNITKVEVTKNSIDTDNLKIDTSSDYLINIKSSLLDNTIFTSSERTPINATDEINWSISDPSIAQIDSKGKITPVSSMNSGNVMISAVINNSNNKKEIKAEKEIRVGGGLNDEHAKLGDNATFKIQGLSDDKRDDFDNVSIDWFQKKSINDNWIPLANNNQTELTLNHLESPFDGSMYHATLSYKNESQKKESFTTNDARLTIDDANIDIHSQLQNMTHLHDPLDTPVNLVSIVQNDVLNYQLHLSNVDKANLKEKVLMIPLPSQVDINSLTINKQSVEPQIQIENYQKKNLKINLTNFKNYNDLDIDLDIQVNTIQNNFEFKSTPFIYGTYLNNINYQNDGETLTLHFITNMLHYKIHDITFNVIQSFVPDALVHRLNDTNAPNNIIDFTDERRTFNPVKILVAQEYDFYDPANKQYLPATLQLHNSAENTTADILHNPTLVANSTSNQKLHYLNWNKNEGLLLKTTAGLVSAGNYSTKLNWTFQESL
ncbi:Ig-like domain-containing protein [Companilactobacillus farciminis]|nr:Ig-like domain-containing protein [Companilactobacillus farciminis]